MTMIDRMNQTQRAAAIIILWAAATALAFMCSGCAHKPTLHRIGYLTERMEDGNITEREVKEWNGYVRAWAYSDHL